MMVSGILKKISCFWLSSAKVLKAFSPHSKGFCIVFSLNDNFSISFDLRFLLISAGVFDLENQIFGFEAGC